MSVSKSKGQASLEMVVGLIILLVVAGVVIALVMKTMNPDNLDMTGEKAQEYMRQCKAHCESKDYTNFCTQTYNSFSKGSNDWNNDKEEGRFITGEARPYLWDFCEDSIYCFLVTECPSMDIKGCREYMCQQYISKYGNRAEASKKLQEMYTVGDLQSGNCYYEERGKQKVYFSNLEPKDNWLLSGFASAGYCEGTGSSSQNCGDGVCQHLLGETSHSQNCPEDCWCGDGVCDSYESSSGTCPQDCGGPPQGTLTFQNCVYDGDKSITCDTNCQKKETVTFMINYQHIDGFNYTAASIFIEGVMDEDDPSALDISGGKVKFTPNSYVMNGIQYSSLDQIPGNSTDWMGAFICAQPSGNPVIGPMATRINTLT